MTRPQDLDWFPSHWIGANPSATLAHMTAAAIVAAQAEASPAPVPALLPAPSTTGRAKVKARFTDDERAALEARARVHGFDSAGTYLRALVSEAVRTARIVDAAPDPSGPTRSVEYRCSTRDVEALDAARRAASRNAWIRAVALL